MPRNWGFETSVSIFEYESEYFEYVVMGGYLNTHIAQCKKTMQTLHKKLRFPLRISSVNMTKSAVSCGFGHIY